MVATDAEMRVRDFASEKTKIFVLEKIEIPDDEETPSKYVPNFTPPPEIMQSIEEAFRDTVRELEGLGWHVQLSRDNITLRGVFKNGKPWKAYDVGMSCERFPWSIG